MRRTVFLKAVRNDLLAIRAYVAEQSGSLKLAQDFVDRLRGQCRRLAALPGETGRARPELGAGIRSFPFRAYVIFFRRYDDRLEIVKIAERHRDIEAFGD